MNGKIVLLAEDNADDEALTLRALKKNSIRNEVVIVGDGTEALDYLFGTGAYANEDRARADVQINSHCPSLGIRKVHISAARNYSAIYAQLRIHDVQRDHFGNSLCDWRGPTLFPFHIQRR